MALTRVYRNGKVETEGFPLADVSVHLEQPDTLVWVDLCGPSKEHLHELADELGLHEVAVDNALSAHQRPKLDQYPSHLFLTCHAVHVDAEQGTLQWTEVDAFIAKRWLVTVRKDDRFPIEPVVERWDRAPDLAAAGVGFLLYGLLDVVVDGHFETAQSFDDYYDRISERIFSETPIQPSQQQHWFQMRRSLTKFHRLVVPMREVLSALMRREKNIVDERLYPYYQDVYDHVLRVTESTDALRDLVSSIVETNLSLRDFRANQVMKKVTSWAAIIAVPTLITGWYGMNVPYPGFGRVWGTIVAAVLVLVGSGALYAIFKRKDWL